MIIDHIIVAFYLQMNFEDIRSRFMQNISHVVCIW